MEGSDLNAIEVLFQKFPQEPEKFYGKPELIEPSFPSRIEPRISLINVKTVTANLNCSVPIYLNFESIQNILIKYVMPIIFLHKN